MRDFFAHLFRRPIDPETEPLRALDRAMSDAGRERWWNETGKPWAFGVVALVYLALVALWGGWDAVMGFFLGAIVGAALFSHKGVMVFMAAVSLFSFFATRNS